MTGPLDQQFAQAREAEIVHRLAPTPPGWDWGKAGDYVLDENGERKHADDCPGCAHDAALSVIERHVQDMETEVERVGILATAVGVARLDLANGDADSAKSVLDNAAAKTHEIIRAALLARGYDGEQVDSFLGAALPAREKGTE